MTSQWTTGRVSVLLLVFGILQGMLEHSMALFADEAGVSDFLVATTGHGPTTFVNAGNDNGAVITSDSPVAGHQLVDSAKGTSCFVASRSIETGSLNWRRNVCSNVEQTHHAVGATATGVFTMDSSGVIRAWSRDEGKLLWDAFLGPTNQPRILVSEQAVAAVADDQMLLLDARTGEVMGEPMSAKKVLSQHNNGRGQAQWLQMATEENNNLRVLLGWVSSRDGVLTTSGSDLLLVDMELQDSGDVRVARGHRLNHIQQIDVSSLHIFASGSAMALSANGKQTLAFGVANGASNCDVANISQNRQWSGLTSLAPMAIENVAQVRGIDAQGKDQQALFYLPSWEPVLDETSPAMAFATCGARKAAVAIKTGPPTVRLWAGESALESFSLLAVSNVPDNALMSPITTVLGCTGSTLHMLLSTSSGTTTAMDVDLSSASALGKWSAEEGLGLVSSALLLDASHAVVVDDLLADDSEEEPSEIAQRLQLSARLSSQWESLVGAGTNLVSASSAAKDRLFGFVQLALLVSARTHRLYGMELAGPARGNVVWTVDLPSQASWHKLVHGTHNAQTGTHGIQGGTHAKEVLVVSASERRVEWKCIDGTHGDVHAEGVAEISSPILQILPIVGSGACRQQAILMHEDLSISVVPDADSESTLSHVLSSSKNGLFTHTLSSGTSGAARLESYQITSPAARLVGQTSFPGERLVHAVYPTRDEVVQSPCTVLGDDSLLLKYLNPHLAVLVTVSAASADSDEEDAFDVALRASKVQKEKKQKKKPLGVTPKTASKAEATAQDVPAKEEEPNLFVSVVDTVSGRVLYRASHANAATGSRHIQAVISENWIVYSFVNAKTRKTEVGVLSLYEGMIHRKGVTAFTSPEQTTEFSSWDARETKPVVLAKTYSIPKPVTAMGVTQTRNGISSHQILLATTEDRIYGVGRGILEPRRPLSELKDSEKLEGLRQYSELIPLVTPQALSYNLTVHAPTNIVSAPTELESQTLVFAYGGPDLFFTRTSPSKGFDMLPESFNRLLLSLLVVGLVSVVVVTKRMATRKIMKHGWL